MIHLADWTEISPYEGDSITSKRKISIVASFAVIILKIILIFAGWRLSIIHKIKTSNPLKKSTTLKMARSKINPARFHAEPEPEQENPKKKKRPVIKYENSKEFNLRFTDSVL